VAAQQAALAVSDFEAIGRLDAELSSLHGQLTALQQESEAAEAALAQAYQLVPPEQLQAGLAGYIELRGQRGELLKQHLEQQRCFCDALAKHIEELTREGRGLNQTVQAFHGYQRAAHLDGLVLDVRK